MFGIELDINFEKELHYGRWIVGTEIKYAELYRFVYYVHTVGPVSYIYCM